MRSQILFFREVKRARSAFSMPTTTTWQKLRPRNLLMTIPHDFYGIRVPKVTKALLIHPLKLGSG